MSYGREIGAAFRALFVVAVSVALVAGAIAWEVLCWLFEKINFTWG